MAIIKTAKLNPEMQEKKEQFLGKIDKAPVQQKKEGPPLYLLAMLLILGILIGVAGYMTLVPKPEPMPVLPDEDANKETPNDLGYREVPVTVLYSTKCATCRQGHTLEELFRVRQIPFSVTRVDVDSNEGRQVISRFRIDRVPAAIVEAKKLSFYPTTKVQFDEAAKYGYLSFRKENGVFVVPEYNTEEIFWPSYFLEKAGGFCEDGKPTIMQFDDFYSPTYATNRGAFYGITRDFNESAAFRFSYTQTRYSQDDNSVLGNIFLMCASAQGKYIEMERAMAGIYCNNPFKGDETVLTDIEIAGCSSLSEHYGTPLSQLELDFAAQRAGLDTEVLKECYNNRKVHYNNAMQAARDLGIGRTGVYLLDCRETSSTEGLQKAFCAMHPQTGKCNETHPDKNAAT